jgi:protein-serine/threonine kinase
LDRNRKTRLGQKGDADEVLSHAFFADLDLKKLKAKELKAPFLPKLPDMEQLHANAKLVNFKDY